MKIVPPRFFIPRGSAVHIGLLCKREVSLAGWSLVSLAGLDSVDLQRASNYIFFLFSRIQAKQTGDQSYSDARLTVCILWAAVKLVDQKNSL